MQKETLYLFWQIAMRYKIRVVAAFIGSATAVLASSFASPFIISRILQDVQANTIQLQRSWVLIILYVVAQIWGELLGWRLNLFLVWTFETASQRDLYKRIFAKLTSHSMSFHANRFGGSLVSQTSKLISAFERFWDTVIFQLIPAIVSILATIIILSIIFWQYALILTILSLIFLFIVFIGSRHLAILNKRESQASTTVTGYVADVVTNILAVKSHGNELLELSGLTKKTTTWREKSLDSMRGFLVISTGYSSLIVLLNSSALIAAIWASERNIISIATIYLAVTYTFTLARQLWEMNSIMRNYNRVIGDAYDMVEILNMDTEISNPVHPEKPRIIHGKIEFKDVTFAYADKNEIPLFSNLNLRIKPGEKVGMVGHSGSGKTTITKLLMRLIDIQSGEILIDGQNIVDLKQSDLRRHIAYVPQEPMLFHRTLAENIAYGTNQATKREIIAIAKMANAHEFINALPDKYDTLVGERGVKLSGGQRQRIAIARAMMKNAPILILDEATSALDSESEAMIQNALWRLMEGRTAIAVAHRLSTIQKMDRILVMDKGTIIEEGSHKDLLRLKGVYANLWNRQSGGFLEV